MPVFSPRRFQPPYYPLHRDGWATRAFTAVERSIKGALFGCRMCGNCILQETAFVCPMTCPMGLRNGLCGGASPEHCAVDPSRPCTWYKIYERAERMGRLDRLLEVNAPLDGDKVGHETWLDTVRQYRERNKGPQPIHLITDRTRFSQEWEQFFHDVRQPEWWEGDAEYHPPAYKEPLSLLEANLRTGNFVTTAEIAPPLGASGKAIERKVADMREVVSAANFTDNASATARMSSLASSKLCLDMGLEPVMQLQARDRSRVALESDVMGACGLGIRNVLCLSGDHHYFGPAPHCKPDQSDMDAVQVLWMLRRMRDEGKYLDGRTTKQCPQLFLGAAASPFGAPPKFEAIRAEKKINAGAQFIQTQPIFDYDRFLLWLEALDKRNLLGKVYVMAGVVPLKSTQAATFMAESVPGVVVPPTVIARMQAAGDDKLAQQETGVAIALELIEKLHATPGIHGIHLMAIHWEEIVPRLVEESGVPKPAIRSLAPAPKKAPVPA
jgi:methylenetetrahydrofolate reductase (NADPH)